MKKNKTAIDLIIAFLIFGIIKFILPTDTGLLPAGANVIAVFAATIYLWLTEGTGWTSMLSLVGLTMSGITTASNMWQISWGNYIIIFCITTMILNTAVNKSGLAKKIALWFITRNVVRNRPYMFICLFLLANMILGYFMSLMPIVMIFMTMAESILNDLGYGKEDKFSKCLYLGIMIVSVVAFGATPIGHSIPLTIMGLIEGSLGEAVPFLKYMLVGIPASLIIFVLMMLVFRFIINPDTSKFKNYDIEARKAEMEPLSKEGKIVGIAFLLVILLWIFPDFGKYFAPQIASYVSSLSVVVPSMTAVVALCVIKVDDKPILKLGEALKGVAWESIVFMATVNAIGSCLTMKTGGISEFLQAVCQPIAESVPVGVVAIIAMLIVIVITNFMSCTVAATMVYSTFIPIIMAIAGGSVSIMGLGVMISFMANVAFMTPGANPSCPVVFGSGYITVQDGVKYGGIMVVLSFLACAFVIWPLAQLVF